MPYDESKDKVLWEGACEALKFSVHSYAGGDPKFQIGPRMVDTTKGPSPRKAGRLYAEELDYLLKNGKKILAAMDGTPAPKKKRAKK